MALTPAQVDAAAEQLRKAVERLERIERAAQRLAAFPPPDRAHHHRAYVLWDDLEDLRAALSS